mmetsp:Transcript_11159/g.34213  ORF Transcript_11159/g.34213 Transcript_11159/m.34213 type:complete len:85 (+) Transcript_11159:42-296(+)
MDLRETVGRIPLLSTNATPRDGDLWIARLKEEYKALIQFVKNNKDSDNDWFTLSSNKLGTKYGHTLCFLCGQFSEFNPSGNHCP